MSNSPLILFELLASVIKLETDEVTSLLEGSWGFISEGILVIDGRREQ